MQIYNIVFLFLSTRIIGFIAGVLTATSMLPQLIKILKEKKADDISIPMLLILLSGLIMWICYGFLKDDWPIIVTNIFSLLLNIGVIFFKFKYRRNQ
ncbi:MAG: SemiSWEET transporter [Chitinophagaceae bacterium]